MESDLAAKQAITEVIYRYCRAIDRLDIDLMKTVWHPDATMDYGAMFKGTREDFIARMVADNAAFQGHQHQINNILIDLDGERAGSETYVTARFWDMPGTGELVYTRAIGCYCDRWSRRNGRWALDHRRFVLDVMFSSKPEPRPGWKSGDPLDRNLGAIDGKRSNADPSYEVLGDLARQTTLDPKY